MRILIKGGVWKNTEDEILKAAVMKYGKNQWTRVASLLNRKSARQCKARWYEWLDPSIKKTEWSKEEEEKLLHLAKLMPNQWRTIAPIVGRTAGQCMEHYERLLDQAQEGLVQDGEDARRLRPGEIDPAPETKPARPDPIDMDEDEKEMLSEARARLANTKGKKAKRKARERQLEESRRLSMLQKRRELKAAGIESKLGGMRKRKYIDYAREVPFQKLAPAGFYDTSIEKESGKKSSIDPLAQGLELSRLENQTQRQEEEKEKEKDKKRLKTLFKANAPQAVLTIAANADPTTLRRRTPLSLPAPQVTDDELEEIVKLGQQTLMPPPEGLPSSSTQLLLGDYSQAMRATPTPLRTPIQEDIVMQEARNLRALRDATPFSEEEMPEIIGGTGFEGITPRHAKLVTPNTFLGGVSGGSTPLNSSSGGSVLTGGRGGGETPLALTVSGVGRTPVRDVFGLNDGISDTQSVSDVGSMSSRQDKQREREFRSQLAAQLRGLPEPEFTYEVSIPEVIDEESGMEVAPVEDAAEVLERQRQVQLEEAILEESRRSAVLRRELPRPITVVPSVSQPSFTGELAAASALICEEMLKLLRYDDYRFPNPESLKKKNQNRFSSQPIDLESIEDEDLQRARELINEAVVPGILDGASPLGEPMSTEAIHSKLDESLRQLVYLPSRGAGGSFAHLSTANKNELLQSLSTQFDIIKAKYDKDAKKVAKLEQKLQVMTHGYTLREDKLKQGMKTAVEAMDAATIELACFQTLREAEIKALPRRLAKARAEVAEAQLLEQTMQLKYAELQATVKSLQTA